MQGGECYVESPVRQSYSAYSMILFRSIGFTLATVVFFALGQARAAEAKRPNILFVMADDHGWMNLTCQGNKLVETSHLKCLAKRLGNYACTTAYRRLGTPAPYRGFPRCPRGGIGRRA